MVKRFCLLALCLCIAITALPISAQEEPPVYVALGDSITSGYGLSPEEKSFPQLLAEEGGYTLLNYAGEGATIHDVFAKLQSGSLDEAIAKAQLITITCGGNDLVGLLCEEVAAQYNQTYNASLSGWDLFSILSGGNSQADPEHLAQCAFTVLCGDEERGIPPLAESEAFALELADFSQTLREVAAYIRWKNPNAVFIIPTQYDPYAHFSMVYGSITVQVEAALAQLNAVILEEAESCGYTVADVYTAFSGRTGRLCNAGIMPLELDYHPNARGHRMIANTLLELLSPSEPEPDPAPEPESAQDPTQSPSATVEQAPASPLRDFPWIPVLLCAGLAAGCIPLFLLHKNKKRS